MNCVVVDIDIAIFHQLDDLGSSHKHWSVSVSRINIGGPKIIKGSDLSQIPDGWEFRLKDILAFERSFILF